VWGTLFVIAGWLTITPMSQMDITYQDSIDVWTDTTSVILVEFSEPMSKEGLTNRYNYRVYDSTATSIRIYRVGIVTQLEDIELHDTTMVALITKRINVKKAYSVQVFNVKDRAGNTIGEDNEGWFYFNGYVPSKPLPNLQWRKQND